MDVDAAQYAMISMEMSETRSFLQVYQFGQDYLDKPPLLFWLSAISIKLFGVLPWAYKLPSVLCLILGIYSTYRFALLYYSKSTALLSALILATSQALFLITNDVRTDGLLLSFVIFSFWQYSAYMKSKKWTNLILAGVGIGLGMLAKGPIALVVFAAGYGGEFLLKRQWKQIFNWRWVPFLFIIGLVLLPMCYGLYHQFDLHPEKEVYGLKGPSGLKFFFWTQSFGRITGESSWSNNSGYFFFLHSILWDLQPWILLFILGMIRKVRLFLKDAFSKVPSQREYITLSAFVLIFFALSLSSYKLPHYIFVIFPFAAIITADFINSLTDRKARNLSKIQFGIMWIFWLVMPVAFMLFFPLRSIGLLISLVILFVLFLYAFIKIKKPIQKVYIPSAITFVAFNLMLAIYFYPNLLSYQGSTQAGKYAHEQGIDFYRYNERTHSLVFSSRKMRPAVSNKDLETLPSGAVLYTNEDGYDVLRRKVSSRVLKSFDDYEVTKITLPFLRKKTREGRLKKVYLIELE